MLEVAARRTLGDLPLDVAFTGPADGVTVLFGPSGAGKSATLAIVAGVLAADAARVALDGHVLTDTSARVFVPPERRRIGIVHQDARLFPHLSVERNLRYGWRRARGERRIAVGEVVEVLAIGPLLGRRPGALSGGERQRVALGRALLSQPSLLLLDEPVSALDHARRDEVLGFVEALKGRFRLPMVYVTHSPDEARRLGDHLVRIDAGRVVAQGRPADLLAGDAVTGTVIGREAGALLVQVGAGTLRVPGLDRPVGATVRIG